MHRAAEITFYDDLGVETTASPEEIRDSFRALVRMLHPDHQTDPQLKIIAERQMRKLNRIYAVLSDPEKRRRYNEALNGERIGPTIVLSPHSSVNMRRLMERVAWLGAFVAAASVLVWLASENQAPPAPVAERTVRRSAVPPLSPPPDTSGIDIAQLQSELRLYRMERDTALREVARLRGMTPRALNPSVAPAPVVSVPPPAVATELPVGGSGLAQGSVAWKPSPARAFPLNPVAAAPVRSFGGFWFYAKPLPPQKARASSLYPPEFIEAMITEQNGLVKGKYRSRYKIVDRAISPDVTFDFAGLSNGAAVTCPWTGPGGAKGEVSLKMSGDSSLLVEWTTTEVGSIQGLVMGTATLTRRID